MAKEDQKANQKVGGMQTLWRSWKGTLILLLAMTAFRSSIADWYHVPTGSMNPTIMEGDRVVVNKLAYDLKVPFTTARIAEWSSPERGDVVVFNAPNDGRRFVKRVVAVPGDEIEVVNNQIILNGVPQTIDLGRLSVNVPLQTIQAEEDLSGIAHAIQLQPGQTKGANSDPVIVPAGCYFVMGDNRSNSADSRVFGCIEGDAILGRCTAIAFSLNRACSTVR